MVVPTSSTSYRASVALSQPPPIDPKQEGLSMYTDIMCAPFISPYCIPLHLSEPFNVDVEYGRISSSLQELELLNAKHQLIEKVKVMQIIGVDMPALPPTQPGSPHGSPHSPRHMKPSADDSPPSSATKSSKANSLLGLDQDSPTSTPVKSSKASMLLGLDEGGLPSSSPKEKKQVLLSPTTVNSPKFGLLARSASNSLLKEKDKDKDKDRDASPSGSVGSGGGSFLGASSQSPLTQSMALNGGSTSTLGMSPTDTPFLLSSSISPLHYQHIFTVSTKSQNYSFNARDRDESSQFVDAIKLISLGKAFHPESQATLECITEALDLTIKCRAPPVPSLPHSPPPPPPHLKA